MMDVDSEWRPVDRVNTRRFQCAVIEEDPEDAGDDGVPRLQLMSRDDGRTCLFILIPEEEIATVREEIVRRGYRGTLPVMARGHAGYGSWRGYLNELELAHIVVEMMGWTLTPGEQVMLDAVDDYGREAPTGFRSPRLK